MYQPFTAEQQEAVAQAAECFAKLRDRGGLTGDESGMVYVLGLLQSAGVVTGNGPSDSMSNGRSDLTQAIWTKELLYAVTFPGRLALQVLDATTWLSDLIKRLDSKSRQMKRQDYDFRGTPRPAPENMGPLALSEG